MLTSNQKTVELACDCRCELSEGPVWHQDALYWVDIVSGNLHRLKDNATDYRHVGGLLGAAIPAGGSRWLLAKEDGFWFFDWENGKSRPLDNPELHLKGNRFNDGKCDPKGRFWAGTMNLEGKEHAGGLYCIDSTLVARQVLQDVSLSNGLAWSPDEHFFYYIDTPSRKVDVFAYDGVTGALSERRTLYHIPEGQGFPDGMTIDENGHLWIALWGGGAVICIDPQNQREMARIDLPVSQPSSCTFGGENLDVLFITSAWQGLTDVERASEPLAGSIFAIKPGVCGLPLHTFSDPKGILS